ncbi:AHH domain-containing protein [Priestia flexa]|uniref:AHH domain-containing protein n=1 Tax=Priestia flexa TaxID=86664 RepID=UPI00240D8733|nr:AHH domain-containing protein [Priestia flexa]WEZ07879.1 AHH domain-containing protein [Priestia flexa]
MSTKLAIEVSKESWKVSIENIKQGTKTALDVTKRSWDGVAGGATDAVVDTWNDLVHMVEDPKGTLQSIGEGAQAVWNDPKGVAKTIGNEIKDSWNEQVINGDAKSRGHYFSYLTANVAMSIVGTKGADKLAKTTKLEQLSGAATKKLNEGAAAIHVRTQSALQNLGLNGLDNRLAYSDVGSVKGNGGYQFIERVDGGNGVGMKVRDESGKDTGNTVSNYLDDIVEAGSVNATKMNKFKNAIQNNTFSVDELSEIRKKMSDLGITKEYNEALIKLDFGKYLRGLIGDPPTAMIDPHAHHILFKKGLGEAQQKLVQEGQELLRKYGIDPIIGKENLVWAPNRVAGQHSIAALENVVNQLKAVDAAGADLDDIIEILEDLGKQAASRK